MNITKVTALYYSATGNTKWVVEQLAATLAETFKVPLDVLDITLPSARTQSHSFSTQELVVAGTPVYAGKIPNKLLPYWNSHLTGNGALAVPVVTFGNRSFDNGLAELCDVLAQHGFRILAAGAFVMPHTFSTTLAADRPDPQDRALLEQLARTAADRAKAETFLSPAQIPGDANAPYYTPLGMDGKPAKFLKAKPKTHADCDSCGLCAAVCPMGAISDSDPKLVPGVCIKCQACVKQCPKHAKYFDDAAFCSHVSMLETHYKRRAHSVIF